MVLICGHSDELLGNHIFSIANRTRAPLRSRMVCDWLLNGPHFHNNFEDTRWKSYFSDVKRLFLDPMNKRWLNSNVIIFVDGAPFTVSGDGINNSSALNTTDTGSSMNIPVVYEVSDIVFTEGLFAIIKDAIRSSLQLGSHVNR